MTSIPFTKLHGLGNDFVLLDVRGAFSRLRQMMGIVSSRLFLTAIADRKTGVGCDQVLVLAAPARGAADVALVIYNADGSKAEMCGNGLRAAALYLWTNAKGDKKKDLSILTASGILRCRMVDARKNLIETEIGFPKIVSAPKGLGHVLGGHAHAEFTCVDVGNPHLVVFGVWPRSSEELAELGSALENHRAFPKRTNVEFVRVRGKSKIEVQVWERGVGRTEACGTGAIAAAVAASARKLCSANPSVVFAGGTAMVRLEQNANQTTCAYLTGTAHIVFASVFNWP